MKYSQAFARAATLSLLAFAPLAGAADAPSAVGFWSTQDHGAVVQVLDCGGGLCGKLVGLRTDHAPGDVPTDKHNPDPAKRGNPMCGLMLMGGLKPASGAAKWADGWVYDPESGSTYSAEMRLDGPDRLKLRGFLGVPLFGRSENWVRETGPQNRCVPPVAG